MSIGRLSSFKHLVRHSSWNSGARTTFAASRAARAARWSSTDGRQWSTPLAKHLTEAITTTGPVSIAYYMRQCLTFPDQGYYASSDPELPDQFGKAGDFVTSPEISQIFGELVGIWFLTEWMNQGKRTSGVELIELGPGRGTLMDDMLRAISNFKPFASAIDTIYLVETSPRLREVQHKLLCGDAPLEKHAEGYESRCKRLPRVNVVWLEDINFKIKEPENQPFIVAHEFFDALPIHAFQSAPKAEGHSPGLTTSVVQPHHPQAPRTSTHNEWREILVSPSAPPSVLDSAAASHPEFELTVSKIPTLHAQLLPKSSPRYGKLLPMTNSIIEISPDARSIMTLMAQMIGGVPAAGRRPDVMTKPIPAGAALVIDYGPAETIPTTTLRGIHKHKRCSPFSSPGEVDVSADVDFAGLAEAALAGSEHVEVHGPAEQGDWLGAMGGNERLNMLVESAKASNDDQSKEIVQRLEQGWNRLISRGPDGMGRLYKVMGVVPDRRGQKRPVGFGGTIDP